MDPTTLGLKLVIDEKFASTLSQLRRNDPSVTNAFIFLFAGLTNIGSAAAAIAEALEANNFVEKVALGVSAEWTRLEQWAPLFRILQQLGRPGGNIKMITILDVSAVTHEASDPVLLVTTASSILMRVQGLASLKFLSLSVPVSKDALTSFLEAASPIFETLHFDLLDVGAPDIPALAAAMRRRHSVKPLTLMLPCSSSSLKLLQSFSAMKPPNLAILMDDQDVDDAYVRQILDAIAKIKSLDMLVFHNVKSQYVVRQLSNLLPAMKLKSLKIDVEETHGWTSIVETKRNLVDAFKHNFSLLHVEINAVGVIDFLDRSQNGKIDFYTQRNARLYMWVQRPESVPKHLWPEALRSALLSGRDEPFHSLQSIAPELVAMRQRRKRKRRTLFKTNN